MRHRLLLLPILAALALPGPAAAHDEGAVPLPDRLIDGIPAQVHGDPIPDGQDAALKQATTLAAARRSLTRRLVESPTTPTLADVWCGTARSTDDTADASTGTGPSIKVVYAYPTDVANQFATRADAIQQDARDISSSFSVAANGLKTVRFDVGTSCGDPYLDIATVALPRTKAAYTGMTFNNRVTALQSDLASFSASLSGTHDVLVYLEDLNAGDGISGVATLFGDDRASSANFSNNGGQFAFVLGLLGGASRRTTAQHELGHNLGAVQDSAPHSTQAGHCFERYDVMCYADGGPRGSVSDLTYPSSCTSAALPAWDCDRGDYFDPAPAAGSYLATHWNLFNSVYLCAPATCFTDDGVIGGSGGSATPPPSGSGGGSSGGGSGGGSSGGGSSGGGGGTTTTPTTPTTPVVVPRVPATTPTPTPPRVLPAATAAQDTPTPAEQVRTTLDAVQARFARASALAKLRAGSAVRLSVTVPASGTLTARLTVRGHTIVRATSTTRASRAATITLRPSASARRTLSRTRATQLALKLSLR